MATIESLADKLRSELGDIARSFVETLPGDGITKRFELRHAPVQGSTLVIKVGSSDVSSTATIEEQTGVLTLASAPASGAVITVSGIHFRYFTDTEISKYVDVAFLEHTSSSVSQFGSRYSYSTLPAVEEYPVVVLAASLALFALATDAAFDIDIMAPDGVTIPRTQRYRQLIEMSQMKKDQYRELCTLLNIGLYRIEVATLRRTSKMTNRLIPVYVPQELDDYAAPQRVFVPMSLQGAQPVPTSAGVYDHVFTQGDDYSVIFDFAFALTGYAAKAQIRAFPESPVTIAEFTCEVLSTDNTQLKISLSPTQTSSLRLPRCLDQSLP